MLTKSSIKKVKGIVFVILSAIGFGLLGLFNTLGDEAGLNIWDRIAIRYFGSAIILFFVLLILRKSFKLPKHLHGYMFYLSVFAFGSTSVLLFFGYKYASTGMVTVLHFIYPIIVMMLCFATGKEKANKITILAAIASLGGLIIIAEPWNASNANPLGLILAIASSVTFAFYVMGLNKPKIKKLDNTVLVFWLTFYSGAVALAIAIANGIIRGHESVDLPAIILPSLGLVVLSTIGAASLFSIGNRLVGGTTASILSMFEPITAVMVGWLFLNETLSPTFLIGALVVIASTVVISIFKFKKLDPALTDLEG